MMIRFITSNKKVNLVPHTNTSCRFRTGPFAELGDGSVPVIISAVVSESCVLIMLEQVAVISSPLIELTTTQLLEDSFLEYFTGSDLIAISGSELD